MENVTGPRSLIWFFFFFFLHVFVIWKKVYAPWPRYFCNSWVFFRKILMPYIVKCSLMLVKTKLAGLHDNNTKFNKCLKNFKHVYDNNMFITCHGLENPAKKSYSPSPPAPRKMPPTASASHSLDTPMMMQPATMLSRAEPTRSPWYSPTLTGFIQQVEAHHLASTYTVA